MRVRGQFAGEEKLGTPIIQDSESPWFGKQPLPRMISNQLTHLFELHMIRLDEMILDKLQSWMLKTERGEWLIVTLVVFLLLHVREIDAGRIIFWKRHEDPVRTFTKVYET